MNLTEDEIRTICQEEFRRLNIAQRCTAVTHHTANRNPGVGAKALEAVLIDFVSACIAKSLKQNASA